MKESSPHAPSMSVMTWRLVRLAGGAALLATAAIHLDLYLTGYSTIPTIGVLFLLQVISAFALAIGVVAVAQRLIALAGAGFLLATLVGYLLSLRLSLFGFREVRTTAGIVAGIIEIVGFATLAAWALRPGASPVDATPRPQPAFHGRTVVLGARWSASVLAVLASVAFGLQLATTTVASTNSGGANAVVKVASIHGIEVLTNKRGYTLYWFVPDSSTKSTCYSTCAAYWPPVVGNPSPVAGIGGSFGTLQRTNGSTQVTYNGHPLYTYIGDSAPGQASGNNVRLNGGLWYEMKASK
jgi:predicted lipoprotein with Yx(FWY)xxD motif